MGREKAKTTSFPIPAYQSIAEGWRTCPLKALKRQFAAFVPKSAANAD